MKFSHQTYLVWLIAKFLQKKSSLTKISATSNEYENLPTERIPNGAVTKCEHIPVGKSD